MIEFILGDYYMGANEIMLIAIIVIIGVILVFGVYFGYIFIKSRITNKKADSIFSPENLVEEESLMNVMDEKKNIEFNDVKADKSNEFFTNVDNVDIVKTENSNEPLNPFGVDLTKNTIEGKDYIKEEKEKAKNKYFQ